MLNNTVMSCTQSKICTTQKMYNLQVGARAKARNKNYKKYECSMTTRGIYTV